MKHRLLFIVAISALLYAAATAQETGTLNDNQSSFGAAGMGASNHFHSLSGVVRTSDGHPAKDVRVEVHDLRNGLIAGSAYTNYGGGFEVGNLRSGNYEIVAQLGLGEARERVRVQEANTMVALRMPPAAAASDAGNNFSVSVAQMKVPEKARNAYKKAASAMEKQKLQDAQKYVAEALAIYPNYSEALTLRGILKLDAGQTDAARADLEQATEADNNYSLAYFALGATYNMLSRWDDALRVLDRGLGLMPTSWQGYFEMGKAFLGKANYEAALRHLNRAEDLQPKYPMVHLVKAHALLGLKNYPEAMSELEAYLEKEPSGAQSEQAKLTLEKVRAFAAANPK